MQRSQARAEAVALPGYYTPVAAAEEVVLMLVVAEDQPQATREEQAEGSSIQAAGTRQAEP